jgi:tRNA(Ile)-lysidine synthase
MLNKFKEHFSLNFSFTNQKEILVATSGGVDSVVLVHLLHTLQHKIVLAHCNFKLREEESDLDAELVVELGKKLNCKTFVQTFNTTEYAESNKVSIQIAARELRYKWFSEIAKDNNIDYIATAHHADDNLETFLINLSRGTGLDGLTGIPELNNNIIRPLLPFSKSDILAYAKLHELEWREDQTNAETKYTRNKVRHQIIPTLKELNPNLLDNFSRTINYLKESRIIIDEKIEEVLVQIQTKEEDVLKFNIEKMLKLKNQKAYLYEVFKRYNFTEWDNVLELLNAQSGKVLYSKTHVILKDRGFLLLKELKKDSENISKFYIEEDVEEVKNPISLSIKNTDKKSIVSKNYALVNKNLVTFPIILRKWEEGDFFYPTGMTGKKKVSKFFKDEKFSKFKKDQTWLLCNANNDIIWIVGTRQDRRFSINSSSKNILQISI